MSAQRVLPSAPAGRSAIAPILVTLAAVLGVALGYRLGARSAQEDLVMAVAPTNAQRVAMVRWTPCDGRRCQTLWLGHSEDDAVQVAALAPGERVDDVAWSRDGYRMGFLISGRELRVFDPEPFKAVATVQLVPKEGDRFARGVTFSDNGAAVTFDDCPRGRSGCRSGMAGVR